MFIYFRAKKVCAAKPFAALESLVYLKTIQFCVIRIYDFRYPLSYEPALIARH